MSASRVSQAEQVVGTFGVGGPLNGFYVLLHVRYDENDSGKGADHVIRLWLMEHFPRDWAYTHPLPGKGKEVIGKFHLRPLCRGRVEHFNGKTFFHPEAGG